jgi:enoyl-CoA hydratase/carnithine racemase
MGTANEQLPSNAVSMELDELLARDRVGTWVDPPALVVLKGATTASVGRLPPTLPAIVVAEETAGPTERRVADVIASQSALPALAEGIASNPEAALVLVQHVRSSLLFEPEDAILQESFAYGVLQAGREFEQWLGGRPVPRQRAERPNLVLVTDAPQGTSVVLNRPGRANMITIALRTELANVLGAIAADGSSLPVSLSGAGRHFCAGGEVEEFGLMDSPSAAHTVRMRANLPLQVLRLAPRLQVHVHGDVIGAGLELSAFAHRVTAAPGTHFQLPEVAMGLLPGCGGTVSVPRRIGRQPFLGMCLTGSRIDAQTALAWGLIDEIVPTPVQPHLDGAD